ncbi:MAG TPA: hypothetical protein PLE54_11505 [Burkholderiaceae bacterium]|nr:hypothetical protein [Burkholderiaceae bacterium]
MISVVTFKWKPRPGYRSKFTSEHVNTLAAMVARHYRSPHRFICITDDPTGLEVEHYPLWDTYSDMRNPTWPEGPSCFRRLRVFDRTFASIAGPRFICLDLDMVITGDVTPLFDRPEPFLMMRTHLPHIPLCGSMFMMNAGVHQEVWDDFARNPAAAIAAMQKAGCRGSDQAWMTYRLGTKVPGWGNEDGVYSYMQLAPRIGKRRGVGAFQYTPKLAKLPEGARIVIFTGKPDPWDKEALDVAPWIREHYHRRPPVGPERRAGGDAGALGVG